MSVIDNLIVISLFVNELKCIYTSYEISSREPMWSNKITHKKFPESDLAFPYK